MQVSDQKVVSIDYTLTDDEGNVLDTSEGNEPLEYLHGAGNIIPGLEGAIEGKEVGDNIQVSVAPADGYGEVDEGLQQQVSIDSFEEPETLELGMQFQIETDQGDVVVTIIEIDDDVVTIDGNHELAGMTLNFDVTIRGIREATAEEIDHGHAHGPGDEHHE